MLEGLEAIPWSDLGGLSWDVIEEDYGSAEDVPALLRALAVPDPRIWVTAMFYLRENLCYLGTSLAEASAFAMPYLLQLAVESAVPCRARILELLALMAQVAGVDSYLPPADSDLEDDPLVEDCRRWSRATRDALRERLEIALRLLSDEALTVRTSAPYLVSLLAVPRPEAAWPEGAALAAASLIGRLEREPEAQVRTGVVYALARLRGSVESVDDALLGALTQDASPQVRIAAALWLVDALAAEAPEAAVTELVAARDRIRTPMDWYRNRVLRIEETCLEQTFDQCELAQVYRVLAPEVFTATSVPEGFREDLRFPWQNAQPGYLACLCKLLPRHEERVFPLVFQAMADELQYGNCGTFTTPVFLTLPFLEPAEGERMMTAIEQAMPFYNFRRRP